MLLIPTAVIDPEFTAKLANGDAALLFTTTFLAFSEELFFRGLLQSRLEASLGSRTGLFMTAVLFSLSHVPSLTFAPVHSPATAVGLAVLDLPWFLVIGYIAQKSNNLLGSTTLHICFNLPILLLSHYGAYY